MGLINALTKAANWGMDVGVTLMIKAPMENAWSVMIAECIQQGYWIIETDQAARRFSYYIPFEMKLNKNALGNVQGQKIIVYVASLGPNHCCVSITADSYNGESLAAGSELLSKGRQRELIGWLVAKIEAKFSIVIRSATPNTPQSLPGGTAPQPPVAAPRSASPSPQNGGASFDFLK